MSQEFLKFQELIKQLSVPDLQALLLEFSEDKAQSKGRKAELLERCLSLVTENLSEERSSDFVSRVEKLLDRKVGKDNHPSVKLANDILLASFLTENIGSGAAKRAEVEKLTPGGILQIVSDKGILPPEITEAKIKKQLDGKGDNETIKVSTICPVTKSRMEYPCRANSCKHLQCFELEILEARMKTNSLHIDCPVCNCSVSVYDVQIDGYFKLAIERLCKLGLSEKVKKLELYADGGWLPAIIEEEVSLLADFGPRPKRKVKRLRPLLRIQRKQKRPYVEPIVNSTADDIIDLHVNAQDEEIVESYPVEVVDLTLTK